MGIFTHTNGLGLYSFWYTLEALTLGQLEITCKNIKYFRGAFMKDNLPETVTTHDVG